MESLWLIAFREATSKSRMIVQPQDHLSKRRDGVQKQIDRSVNQFPGVADTKRPFT